MPPDLFTVKDCERLRTRQVHKLYRKHVNRSQGGVPWHVIRVGVLVMLMTSFGFGRELVDHAEGVLDLHPRLPTNTRFHRRRRRPQPQIGRRLGPAEATVKRHLSNIYVKLDAVSRIDAVNKAVAAAVIVAPKQLG
jgi:hypothetical protein